MRSTTQVVVAFRNVGNSEQAPQIFNGTIRDSIMWLAEQLGTVSMASKIKVCFARNEVEALIGVRDGRAPATPAIRQDFQRMLDMAFSDDPEQAIESAKTSEAARDPDDDYKG